MSVSNGNEISVPVPLHELKKRRKPVRNVNVQHRQQLSRMERVALVVTQRVGTMGFFLIIAGWSGFWLIWNLTAPRPMRFDPHLRLCSGCLFPI